MISLCRSVRVTNTFLARLYTSDVNWSSSNVRKQFIDYFVNENGHKFLRSSPLRPISDQTIPFVNAGMVQFKSVLQGKHLPPAPQVANSQKCARVGGKHNDLDAVGLDGYHHTFFEMLGSWSFGSCDKSEACKMAWKLLTGPFGLNPRRLYVTYFGGDVEMGLAPDSETKEVWRQLGVQESHILPFGTSDNFWEMGLVGPCGPCTEIHVDHVPGRTDAGARVNAGFPDLTELWNIVFIQFNRNNDGSLTPLKYSHVDTGMGFERLVALLNGAKSNYDTDLFIPLMQAIHKISGCAPYSHSFDENDSAFQKDKTYRILADHARLLTVAIADGVFPHLECKLRWVMRRALHISDNLMRKEGNGAPLLIELSNYVADSLHTVYPEIGKNLKKVERTIAHEAEIYQAVTKEFPKNWIHLVKSKPELEGLLVFGSNRSALAAAYRKMNGLGSNSKISPALAYHMYESHGMSAEIIGEMAKISGKTFCVEEYENEFEKRRKQSMLSTATNMTASPDSFVALLDSGKVAKTNDMAKYDYSPNADRYSFPSVSAKVVGILQDGLLKKSVEGGSECGVVLDCTNFYHTAGGQASDEGEILVPSSSGKTSLSVKEVLKLGNYVIHYGHLNGTIKAGDSVITKIDEVKRLACMRNHTLAHLITASMQQIFDAPLQEKCSVNPSHVKMAYNLHGQKLTIEEIKRLQESIQYTIDDELPVSRYSVNSWEIPTGTTILPDESYPVDNIHIIDVKRGNKIVSREACCGTHIMNTKDIGKFCISEVILSKKANCVICALTGPDAAEASRNSITLSKNVNNFLKQVLTVRETVQELISSNSTDLQTRQSSFDAIIKVHETYNSIKKFMLENSRRISYLTYDSASAGIREGLSEIHSMSRAATEFDVKRKAMNGNFVVHFLPLSECLEKISLSKYTRLVSGPIMLFALQENETKVRCCVPQEIVSENFNAVVWMQEVLPILVQSEGDVDKTNFRSDGQTLTIQSRSFIYKSKIPFRERKHRCYEGCKAASKFVSRQFKGKRET